MNYNWTDEYREIIEQYWWEPQRFGRAATNPKKFPTADAMWKAVAPLEQSLNHLLNLFFALFPLEKLDLGVDHDGYEMLSSRRLDELERDMQNVTQPDLYFVGTGSHLAIELKTKSRSSLDQVKKYIAFHDFIDANIPLKLVYLTPHVNIIGVFKERFTTESELRDLLSDEENNRLQISFMSIRTFNVMLDELNPDTPIEKKLISGLQSYLEEHFRDCL